MGHSPVSDGSLLLLIIYIRLQGRFPVGWGCPIRLLSKGIYGFVGGLIWIIKNSFSLSLLENYCTSSFIWNLSMRDGFGQKERPLDNKFISLSERGTLEMFTTVFMFLFSCSTLFFVVFSYDGGILSFLVCFRLIWTAFLSFFDYMLLSVVRCSLVFRPGSLPSRNFHAVWL